jgi:hypothetical protein
MADALYQTGTTKLKEASFKTHEQRQEYRDLLTNVDEAARGLDFVSAAISLGLSADRTRLVERVRDVLALLLNGWVGRRPGPE